MIKTQLERLEKLNDILHKMYESCPKSCVSMDQSLHRQAKDLADISLIWEEKRNETTISKS